MGQKNALPGKSSSGPSNQWPAGLELMNAVAVSGAATFDSSIFNAANLDNIGIQLSFVGTMVGTVSVQCSIDNVNYIDLTFIPALAQPNGSNLSYLISLNQLPYPYTKVHYVNSSGSGTLTAFLSAKDLN